MTGHNVEEVFSLAAKDMYVKTVMKAEEDKKNGANIVINIPTDQCPHIYNTQCIFHLWININI